MGNMCNPQPVHAVINAYVCWPLVGGLAGESCRASSDTLCLFSFFLFHLFVIYLISRGCVCFFRLLATECLLVYRTRYVF